MFTGIVQTKVAVQQVTETPGGVRLVIDRTAWSPPGDYHPAHGDSICINGVCLTVVESDGCLLHFDVIRETLDKTTLGEWKAGDAVNIEPAVTASQPLGGHFMQGHVDGVGTVTRVVRSEAETRLTLSPPSELATYFVPKGSVAIDGVSLTIASVEHGEDGLQFDVALIPTTLDLTTLGQTRQGDRMNLEADIISKTVVHHLQAREQMKSATAITVDLLDQAGFVSSNEQR